MNFAEFDAYLLEFSSVLKQIFWVLYAYFVIHAIHYFYLFVFCKGITNYPTAPKVRKRGIEIMREDMQKKAKQGRYTIVDMGSGYGFFVRDIAKHMPQAHVIGIDYDPLAGKVCNFFKKFLGPKNAEFVTGDFTGYNLAHADAVVLFLPIEYMPSLGEQLKSQLKEGALVICNRFNLEGGWEPVAVEHVKAGRRKQGKINIYRR